MTPDRAKSGQDVVGRETQAHTPGPGPITPIRREEEGLRADEMRRRPDQDLPLAQRLEDQAEVEVLEVAEAAVDELRRSTAGSAGVVALLDEADVQAAEGHIASDRGSCDAAAHHEHVKGVGGQALEVSTALLRAEGNGLQGLQGLPQRLDYAIFKTIFPSCSPASRRSWACRAFSRGQTTSMTGSSFFLKTSDITRWNSERLAMVVPMIFSCFQ